MEKQKQLLIWLALFALLSNCAHIEKEIIPPGGPAVIGCVVDIKAGGYQCVSGSDQSHFFLSFKDATEFQCLSSKDLESYLKACKKGQVAEITMCTSNCADNSFCLTPKDWKRVSERCYADGD